MANYIARVDALGVPTHITETPLTSVTQVGGPRGTRHVVADFSFREDFFGDSDRWSSKMPEEWENAEEAEGDGPDLRGLSRADGWEGPWVRRNIAGTPWTIEEAGEALVTGRSDEPYGSIRLALDSTSQAQLARLWFNDAGGLAANGNVQVEFILKFPTLPTTGTIISFGLATELRDNPDDIPIHAGFRLEGSGAVLAESDDGTNDNDDKSTGLTVTADSNYVAYRIDWGNVDNVKFYINGVRVASSTTFDLSNASVTDLLQPYIQLWKPEGSTVGTVEVDLVWVWGNR